MRKLFLSGHAIVLLVAAFAIGSTEARAQSTGEHEQPAPQNSISDSLRDLQAQVTELKSLVVEMRDEVARSRAETTELRRELEAARAQLAPTPNVPTPPSTDGQAAPPASEPAVEQRLAKLEEDQQLLSDKVDDQYQTKVESGSKYRVRFSGIVLLNLFDNIGAVNNQDFPTLAEASGPLISGGGFGGSLRQSQLGFEVFGPEVGGARTSADIQFDFAGGFPNAPNGVTFGLVRLRTGTIRLDWGRTSIIAGQDALFLSPLAATSLASLAEPVLSYAGDLWSWSPQLRIEHRVNFSDTSNLLLEAGILYSLAGQPPASEYQFFSEAGESAYEYQLLAQLGDSRQPAYASRIAWTHTAFGKSFTLGGGGYYARQNWGFSRNVDAWASTADWTFAFAPRFEISGEFYRGRAVGGLGGGIGGSVTLSGPIADPSTMVRGLDSLGGWGQLKFRATDKLEFNGAFGQDNPFASEIRSASGGQQNYFNPWLARNQSWLVNFIYHPRSDLLFSAEYHYLRTFTTVSEPYSAQHINLSLGVLF